MSVSFDARWIVQLWRGAGGDGLYLAAGYGLSTAAGMAVTVALTRYLGAESYGSLSLAYALVQMAYPLTGASLKPVFIRAGSQPGADLGSMAAQAIWISVSLGALATLLIYTITPLLHYPGEVAALARLAALALVISPFSLARWVLMSTRRIRTMVVLDGVVGVLGALAALAIVITRAGREEALIVAGLGVSAVGGLLFCLACRTELGSLKAWRIQPGLARMLMVQSLPVTVAGLVVVIQGRIGPLLIGQQLGSAAAARYLIAYNLITIFNPFQSVLFEALYPHLARSHAAGPGPFRAAYRGIVRGMLRAILPFAGLAALTGQDLIRVYAGAGYSPGAGVMAALAVLEVLVFYGAIFNAAVISARLQRILAVSAPLGAGLMVALQVALLPGMGLGAIPLADGAARLVVLGALLAYPPARSLIWIAVVEAALPAAAITGVVAGLWVLRIPWYLAWPLGVAGYAALLGVGAYLLSCWRRDRINPGG